MKTARCIATLNAYISVYKWYPWNPLLRLADVVTGVTSSLASIFGDNAPSLITAIWTYPSDTAQCGTHRQTPEQRLFDTVGNCK